MFEFSMIPTINKPTRVTSYTANTSYSKQKIMNYKKFLNGLSLTNYL